jgi:tRNA U34 2-thiouridine synthase MnmA/TrmU
MSGSFPPHDEEKGSFRALAQFRHRMAPAPCTVSRRVSNTWAAPVPEEEKTVIIDFDEPQFAVAPGQIAAVYIGEQCMGCGPIERVGHETNVA